MLVEFSGLKGWKGAVYIGVFTGHLGDDCSNAEKTLPGAFGACVRSEPGLSGPSRRGQSPNSNSIKHHKPSTFSPPSVGDR